MEKYTLRKLCADDMFSALRIISKIGLKDVRKCFAAACAAIAEGNANAEGNASAEGNANAGNGPDVAAAGMRAGLEIAGLLAEHLPDCKEEIFSFLANLSGMDKKEIARLDMVTFMEMVMDVIRKEEFRDFFTAAARLLKQEK